MQSQAEAQDAARTRHTAIVTAAARLAPAVVSVNVLRRERQLPQNPFDLFFTPRGTSHVVEGYGSGFIISPDGVVITNQHVTQGAEQIVVTTREGTDYPAKLRSGDVILQINRVRVSSADDLRRAFAGAAGAGAATVWFERAGRLGRTAFYVR